MAGISSFGLKSRVMQHRPSNAFGLSVPDVVVADWEFLHAEQVFLVYLEHLLDAAIRMRSILRRVRQEAISDDEDGIAAACERFADQVYQLFHQMDEMHGAIRGKADEFIAEIDPKDKFLYGG